MDSSMFEQMDPGARFQLIRDSENWADFEGICTASSSLEQWCKTYPHVEHGGVWGALRMSLFPTEGFPAAATTNQLGWLAACALAKLVINGQRMEVSLNGRSLEVFRLPQRELEPEKWRAEVDEDNGIDFYAGAHPDRHRLRVFLYGLWLEGYRWKIPSPEYRLL